MTGDWSADAVTASGTFCALRHAASCIPAALTARIPKNNALLVTIFLISEGFPCAHPMLSICIEYNKKKGQPPKYSQNCDIFGS